jgi:membrane-associated phospholipid phosphatase
MNCDPPWLPSGCRRPERVTLNRRLFLIIPMLALGLAGLATLLQGATLWNVGVVRSFQGSGALRLPIEAVTTLGSEEFFLLFLSLVFWCIDKPLGVDFAVLVTLAATANIALKALLQRPRPFWSDPALRLATGGSFSTPSGHAANSTVIFGYLAWWLTRPPGSRRRTVIAVLLVTCIFLICVSRVYLGVHFPGDVIWGCAEGIVLLAAYIGLRPRIAPWLQARSLAAHIILAAGAATAILALSLLFLTARPGSALRFGAVYDAALAQAVTETGDAAGLVLGMWVGLALEGRYVRFKTAGPAGQRALRYIGGLAGLLAVWLALRLVLPTDPPALGLALRVARYAIMGLWAVFAWPWLFVRIGLGEADRPAAQVGGHGI